MSDRTESRVVQIRFDNKDFEKNVQQSLDTLTRLNKALEFKDGKKGLNDISNAANKVDMTSLSRSVDETANHFSKLEVMGVTALANITNSAVNAGKSLVKSLIDPVVKGGWQRALNMEQAKFMFEGLGYTSKDVGAVGKVGTIMDNIFKSVDGTVYSLDKASLLASQLMASGIVGTGKNSRLEHVLKAVAGLSSVYNADYERVGEIFGEVKAQSVLMGQQVDSLRSMRVPIYKILADYLNKQEQTNKYDEQDIKELIRKQKIDFDTFSDALEEKFADQAAKSKNTFTGAMEDMRAAANRLGEDFYETLLPGLRDFFNALVPLYDAIANKFEKPIKSAGNTLSGFLSKVVQGVDIMAAVFDFDETYKQLKKLNSTKLEDGTKLASDERLKNLEKYKDLIIKIRTILSGVANVLRFVGSVFQTVWSVVSKAATALSPVASLMLDLTVGLAHLSERLDAAIEKMNAFAKSSGAFFESMTTAVQNSKLLAAVSEKIKTIFADLTKFASDFGDSLVVMSKKIGEVAYNLVDGLFNALQRAKEGMGQLLKISDVTSTFLGMVLASKFAQLGSIFEDVTKDSGNLFVLLKKLGATATASLNAFSGKMYSVLLEFEKTMEVYQRSLNADILLKIAIAIGAIAISMKILSTIDPQALLQSVGAMAVLVKILKKTLFNMLVYVNLMSGFKLKDMAGFFLLQTALIRIALAFIGMATAVKILATLDMQQVARGLIGIWALSKILTNVLKELSTIPKLNFVTANLTLVAIAIDLLAVAMKLVATMSWEEIAKGAVGLLATAFIMTKVMKEFAKLEKQGKGVNPLGFLVIAISMDLLAIAFRALGKMSWEQFAVAASGMIVLASGLSVLMLILGKMDAKGDVLKNAAALLAVSIAFAKIGKAFKKLGEMDWEQLGRAAVGMLALEFFIGSLMDIMSSIKSPQDLLTRIGALLGIAISMQILVGAFARLGKMEWGEIAKAAAGMGSIEAMVLSMMGIMKAMKTDPKDLLLMAGGMIAMGIAMQVFSIGLAMLGNLPIETIGKGLLGFAAAIVVFAVIADSLQGSLGSLLKLAGTLAVLGLSFVAIGAGFMMIGYGLQVISKALAETGGDVALKFAIMAVILAVLTPLLKTAGVGMAFFGVGIAAVGIGMILVGAGLAAIGLGLKTITVSMEQVVASLNSFADIDWNSVGNLAALVTIFGLLSPLALALGLGLAAVGAGLLLISLGVSGVAEGFMLIKKAIVGIFDNVGSKVEAMCDRVSNKLKLFKDTIKNFAKVVKELIKTLKTTIKGINDLYDTAYKAGSHVVKGVVNGIEDGTSSAAAAARSLARATLAAYKDEMGIQSPSKEMAKLGRWDVLGLVKGHNDNISAAKDSMSVFAKAVLDAYSMVNDNADLAPTITPVVDTSNVAAAVGSIDSMMASRRVMNLSSDISNGKTPAGQLMDTLASMASGNNTSNNQTNYITVDGAEDPMIFADKLVRGLKLNARTI